jgi:subtilisin-like proprotein convertase family protein
VRARSSIVLLAFIVFTSVVLPSNGTAITYVYDGPFRPIPADANLNIGPMDDAVIDVPAHLIITDLDVAVDIVHTNVFDLDIVLKGPAGQEIYLNFYEDINGLTKAQDYSGTVFDDEAFLAIEQGSAPFTGHFRPKRGNFLSTFYGTDAFGEWRLYIDDIYENDRGHLENFELRITVPEPATFMLFSLAGLFLRRRG